MSQSLSFSLVPPERYRAARAWLCRAAAVCAVANIGVQAFQEWVFHLLPEDATGAQAIAVRAMPLDRARALVVLATIPLLFIISAATTLDRVRRAPGCSLIGFAGALLFTVFELGYRSIDYFYISIHTVHAFQTAQLDAVKQALIERVTEWDALVGAIYFPLVLAGLVANTCFSLAMRHERRWAGRAGFAAFTINAVRLVPRLLSFAGVSAMEPLSEIVYFPVVLITNLLLVFWLWNTARADIGEI